MSLVKWERVMQGAQAVVLAMLVFGCAPQTSPSPSASAESSQATVISLPTILPNHMTFEQMLPLFEYSRTAPLDIIQAAAYPNGTTKLEDVTYMGANGIRMPAYIVRPAGNGPFPGVVWMGWTGDYSAIRKEFLAEALELADHGVASLLVAGYFPWHATPTDKDADRMAMIGQVRDLRRAIDLLCAEPGVDSSRIAFVGHSMGAMHGVALAAVDHRIKAAVLMTPHSTMTDWVFQGYGLDPMDEASYRAAMASFDPISFAPHTSPTSLFFQFGSDDQFVPNSVARELYGVASQPKRIGWYAGGHDLDATAKTDRDTWLMTELRISN